MYKITLIAILLLLSSCSNQEEEVTDLSDILPQSERDDESDTTGAETDSTRIAIQWFQQNGLNVTKLAYSENRLFPDRFRPERAKKYVVNISGDSLLYCSWTYSDSIKTMSAFYNWLDYFGIEEVGAESKFQSESMCLLVGDTSLIYISGGHEDLDSWLSFHESIGYEMDWSYAIEQRERGRARWYTFVDEKKVKLNSNKL